MRFTDKPRRVYPAANRIIQIEAAARMGFIGETEVSGDALEANRITSYEVWLARIAAAEGDH